MKNDTHTAEGPISYWNAYVAVTQTSGQGDFSDPQLGIEVKHSPDMVSPKLPALRRTAPRLCVRYGNDGSAATLADVVVHYNRVGGLGLIAEQQRDLVEYLKSL